jgi:tRNA(Ile)-lysidine synthase
VTYAAISAYHLRVQDFPSKVRAYIEQHQLLKAGKRVGVAVSGGADSVALLRSCLDLRKELGVVVSVVHFNHKLRGVDSDGDEKFVAELAQRYELELHCESGDVATLAAAQHKSIEAAAREVRYAFFRRLLTAGKLDRLATAHTLDDQAETLLMRMVRGAGTRGLAGIYPQLPVPGSRFSEVGIIRPLLGIQRKELESYLAQIRQDWREDKSNRDLRYARNRVRHGILPRLERSLNPAVREALAGAAEIARAEEAYWQTQVAGILPQAWDSNKLNLSVLTSLSLAVQRRLVRAVGERLGLRLEFKHIEAVLAVAFAKEKTVVLPEGWTASRNKHELYFTAAKTIEAAADYQHLLPIPGCIEVPEAGVRFEAVMIQRGEKAEYNRRNSLDLAGLMKPLLVRNWRAGDRFWPAHTKSPKKIKELLQERHVSGTDRQRWPVVVSGEQIVWLRGFPVPTDLQPREGAAEAVLIQEFPLLS